MVKAGLVVTEDSMGSIFGTWYPASTSFSRNTPAVGTGSHCDAIPLAGAYDGTLGVIGGIEAIRALREAGFRPARPLQVVMFTSEEPTRFGLSCLGSRAMAGAISASHLAELRDENNTSFLAAAKSAGSALGAADEAAAVKGSRLTPHNLSSFLELHIEQGPELEAENLQIGVVVPIAAPVSLRVSFQGSGGHAGALLMPRRHDASLAAADLALAVERFALNTGEIDTVATTGRWEISPNAVNSVPSKASIEIDVRDVDQQRRDALVKSIKTEAASIAEKRGVDVVITVLNSDPPAVCDAGVIDAVEGAVTALGYSAKRMVSRAYHDSLFMAQLTPTGMVFVPCAGGRSHRPDEFASAEDIERGVRVLAGALATLAGDDAGVKGPLDPGKIHAQNGGDWGWADGHGEL